MKQQDETYRITLQLGAFFFPIYILMPTLIPGDLLSMVALGYLIFIVTGTIAQLFSKG